MALMNKTIIWVHGDCLNPHQTAFRLHPGAPAIYVWDDDLLLRRELSLKRILFIYESLLELPIAIRRGQVAEEILAAAEEHNRQTVVTARSVSPGFERICRQLRKYGVQVYIYEEEPFINLPQEPDLHRFSRYWKLAKRQLIQPTD